MVEVKAGWHLGARPVAGFRGDTAIAVFARRTRRYAAVVTHATWPPALAVLPPQAADTAALGAAASALRAREERAAGGYGRKLAAAVEAVGEAARQDDAQKRIA